jgi:hypothetical protein
MIPNVLLFCISSETFEEEKRKSELHLLFCKSPPPERKSTHRPRWFNLQKMSNQIIPSDGVRVNNLFFHQDSKFRIFGLA